MALRPSHIIMSLIQTKSEKPDLEEGEPTLPTSTSEFEDLPESALEDRTGLPWPMQELQTERQIYGAMTQAVISRTEMFLRLFHSIPGVTPTIKSMIQEDFFPRFKGLANQWTEECCHRLARIIRSTSRLPNVRETPGLDLARRIRETAFHSLDAILFNYADTVKHLEVVGGNMGKIRAELAKAVGTGPSPDETAASPSAGSAPPPTEEWATDQELIHQETLLFQAQSRAFAQIIQYLKSLNELPAALLSYAGDKCFGGEGNYQFELEGVSNIKAELRPKLTRAIETLEQAGVAAKTEVEKDVTSILTNIQLEQTNRALETIWAKKIEGKVKARQKRDRLSILVLGLLLLLAAAYLYYVFTRPWRGL